MRPFDHTEHEALIDSLVSMAIGGRPHIEDLQKLPFWAQMLVVRIYYRIVDSVGENV